MAFRMSEATNLQTKLLSSGLVPGGWAAHKASWPYASDEELATSAQERLPA